MRSESRTSCSSPTVPFAYLPCEVVASPPPVQFSHYVVKLFRAKCSHLCSVSQRVQVHRVMAQVFKVIICATVAFEVGHKVGLGGGQSVPSHTRFSISVCS